MAACVGATPEGGQREGRSVPSVLGCRICVPLLPRRPAPTHGPVSARPCLPALSRCAPSSHSKQTKWAKPQARYILYLPRHPSSSIPGPYAGLPSASAYLTPQFHPHRRTLHRYYGLCCSSFPVPDTYKTPFHSSSRSKFCKASMVFLVVVVVPSRAW
jgi:hypothetical protein